ncbi:MAG: metal ABC transporter permease, partial [Verrucomicrobiota bacterium]
MDGLIPEFSFQTVFADPWQSGFTDYVWIWVMGLLVSLSCGVVGNFIILRRMALVGDAISHSVLPGLVIAFLMTGSLEGPVMIIGAAIAGVLTTVLIEIIYQNSRVKSDAALGIVFSTLFAIGVILITMFAGNIHLDVEHVLYGAIEFIAWQDAWEVRGFFIPYPVIQMCLVGAVIVLLVMIFYKELVASSFDPVMAASLGMPVKA